MYKTSCVGWLFDVSQKLLLLCDNVFQNKNGVATMHEKCTVKLQNLKVVL